MAQPDAHADDVLSISMLDTTSMCVCLYAWLQPSMLMPASFCLGEASMYPLSYRELLVAIVVEVGCMRSICSSRTVVIKVIHVRSKS